MVPRQGMANAVVAGNTPGTMGWTARRVPRIFTASPPEAAQPEFTGWANAEESASQSCTRAVEPSIEKVKSGGQRNSPFARGKREPCRTKEFCGAPSLGSASGFATIGGDAIEIVVGAKSISP